MIIKNAHVLDSDFKICHKDVSVQGEYIKAIKENLTEGEVIDGTGCFLIPGFIDIHTHGCVGFDSCDANKDGYEKMTEFYISKGVTSFLFTTMTLEESELENIAAEIGKFIDSGKGKAYAHGIYLEGPFINAEKKGAQAGKYIIAPNMDMYNNLNEKCGNRIKVVALAPEVEGSMEFIKKASKECAISIAHTKADYDIACEAIGNGVTGITHLFNAMPPFGHRDPGVLGAAFDSDVYMEMICDGIHLHPSVIRTVFKLAGDDRVVLISDSMRAAGMSDGEYTLGGQDVTVVHGKATLKGGTIAGSASNMLHCVKNCLSFGIGLESVVKAASLNPAKLIGIDAKTGSIQVGKYADMLLIDKDFNIQKAFVKGELMYEA